MPKAQKREKKSSKPRIDITCLILNVVHKEDLWFVLDYFFRYLYQTFFFFLYAYHMDLRLIFNCFSWPASLAVVGVMFFRQRPWFFHSFVFFFLLPYCIAYTWMWLQQLFVDPWVLLSMDYEGVMRMFMHDNIKVTSTIHFLEGDIQSAFLVLMFFDKLGITSARHWAWKAHWALAPLFMLWEPVGKLFAIGLYVSWVLNHGLPRDTVDKRR